MLSAGDFVRWASRPTRRTAGAARGRCRACAGARSRAIAWSLPSDRGYRRDFRKPDRGRRNRARLGAGALRQAQAELADRVIRPALGHIGLTDIDPGDRVSDTPIAQIDQRSRLYIDFPAPEEVFTTLREGRSQVAAFSDPDNLIDARIVSTDSCVASDSRFTFARRSPPGRCFRPGMSFRVTFTRDDVTRAAVAEEAIVWRGGSTCLSCARARRRECRLRSLRVVMAWRWSTGR